MKFGQLIENKVKNVFFFKNYTDNEPEIPVPDLFLFFKKALFKTKASGQDRNFKILW